jgi:hypothetical protein
MAFWWSNALNIDEVKFRLNDTDRFREIETEVFRRSWNKYLWNNIRSTYADTYNYNENWSTLKVGIPYMVSSRKKDGVVYANVFIFRGYRELDDNLIEERKSCVRAKLTCARQRRDYMRKKYNGETSDSGDDEIENYVNYEVLSDTRDEIRNLRQHWVMEKYVLKFENMRTGVIHELDPCGSDTHIEVTDLFSSGWSGMQGEFRNVIQRGERSMNALLSGYAQCMRQEVAALLIQKQWRESQVNPMYSLCRKRLIKEFESDNNTFHKRIKTI